MCLRRLGWQEAISDPWGVFLDGVIGALGTELFI